MNFVRELKFEQNKSSNLKNPGTSKFDLSQNNAEASRICRTFHIQNLSHAKYLA